MIVLQRRVGIFVLLALFIAVGMVSAQDSGDAVTLVGSNVFSPVFDALKEASGVTVNVTPTIAGTRSGFQAFCAGQADLATATRAISTDENKDCVNNNVAYTELLVAHNILVFISPADSTYGDCLTPENLNSIFPPSAQGKITNWNQFAPEAGDIPLTVFVSNPTSETYAALDGIVEGDGIRSDASFQGSDSEVATAVGSTPGSIGVVTLPVAIAAGSSVKIAQLNVNSAAGCTTPTPENVEQRLYSASADYFIYVNRASLEKPGLKDLLSFAGSDQAASVIDSLALTAPSATAYSSNVSALEGEGSTHPFSESSTSFNIPVDAAGQVTIAGSPVLHDYLTSLAASLTGTYSTITTDIKTTGLVAGVRRLCNGEIDVVATDGPLTAEQTQNCDANNIKTFPVDLGRQTLVLVSNSNSPYLACLTNEQIAQAWNATSTKTVTNWNQVDASFADQKITLFAPPLGDTYADLLMEKSAGSIVPIRDDIELNADPLYRAAATANVEGALTYMDWADYQKVLANNQERIQLVGVDNGSGCVVPSEATVADGSYELTRSAQLLVNEASLTKVQVQSFLWYLAADGNYNLLETSGFSGLGFTSLPALRETLQKAYVDAAVAATQVPEATAEATGEATTEATGEATAEATPAS